jgi:cytochrome b561
MNESATAWPLSLRLAHWLSAILVLAALGLGAYMVLLVANPAQRFDLTQTHKALGITILALTVVRLACRAFMRAPKPEQAAPSIGWAAKASHIALYGLLLLMPLSGWLMASSTPIRVPTSLFGLLELPYPLTPNLATYRLAHTAHLCLAILLALLIALHLGATMVHAIVWRDRTFARMCEGRCGMDVTDGSDCRRQKFDSAETLQRKQRNGHLHSEMATQRMA